MNQKIKELLEAIMEEAMAIGAGAINTTTSALGTPPTPVVGSEKKYTKQNRHREHKGQLNYKFVKIHNKKGKVQ